MTVDDMLGRMQTVIDQMLTRRIFPVKDQFQELDPLIVKHSAKKLINDLYHNRLTDEERKEFDDFIIVKNKL